MRLGSAQSTLLGPEGITGPALLGVGGCLSELPGMAWETYRSGVSEGFLVLLVLSGFGVFWWVVGWSLVENCTVDASIFVFCG